MSGQEFDGYSESLHEGFRQGDSRVHEKEQEEANVRLLQDVALAIGRDDLAAVGELFSDDIQLEIRSPRELPFIRSASGKEGVLTAIRHNFGEVRDQRPTIEAVVAQGNTVVVLSREEGIIRASGERYDVHVMHRYVCRGGKVTLVQELIAPA